MTKQELVNVIAKDAGIRKYEAEKAVSSFIGAVSKALKKGDKVTLVGFGSFYTKKRKARKVKPPTSNKVITTPAMRVPKFKPGKALKSMVRRKR
jgi:DNA-binding protein HU-beta